MKVYEFIEKAMKRFQDASDNEIENRENSMESIKFVDGDQWPEEVKASRQREFRPCHTINKLRKFVQQILGEWQQSRQEIKIVPYGIKSSSEGADVRNALINFIQKKSSANEAYDNAFEQILDGGFGYWRVITEYDNDSDFDQNIAIKAIDNRFSVYFDPYHSNEDAEYCFITEEMTKEEFKEKYGKEQAENITSISSDSQGPFTEWQTKDMVRIAEYYYVEKEYKTIYQLKSGEVVDSVKNDIIGSETVKNKRRVEVKKIFWCKISHDRIIEEPREVYCKYIPVVKVVGHDVNYNGKWFYRSFIYDSIDSMRQYNYWRSYSTEIIALAPKAPYIMTDEQIGPYKDQWQKSNIENRQVLLYTFHPNHPKPQREPQVQVPAAAVNESLTAEKDISDTLGRYQSVLGGPSNERSGRAILARSSQSDNTIYKFFSNLLKAMTFTGKILLDMLPKIYDTERQIMITAKEGQPLQMFLNTRGVNEYGESVIMNDLKNDGEYSVMPITSPEYKTRKLEIASSMLDFLQFVPMAAPVIAPKLAKLMEWEDADTVASELQQIFSGDKTSPNKSDQRGN